MFEIKGTGIIGLIDFVKTVHGADGHRRWLLALSPEARQLAGEDILAGSWYPGPLTMEMRRAICDVFYGGDLKGARALGRHSAQRTLTGVYKLAVRLGSPEWVLGRASTVFSTFFRPGSMKLTASSRTSATIIVDFPDRSGIMEQVFCGFVEVGLELSGARDVAIDLVRKLSAGDPVSEIGASWRI